MNIRTLSLILLTALAMPFAAHAGKGAKTGSSGKTPGSNKSNEAVDAYLTRYDKNKDGVIDKSEYQGSDFAKWDKNSDGKLDKGELRDMLGLSKKK